MAVPASASSLPDRRPLTRTERNWLWALGIVVGGIALAALVQQIETGSGLTDRKARLVGHPVEASMRFLALPHFVIAILFMTTSRAMQRPRAWAWLGAYAGLGVLLCWAFAETGARAAAIPNALFLSYFLVHEFRDQAFFYRVNGDAPATPSGRGMRLDLFLVPALGLATILGIFLFGAAFGIGGARRYTATLFGTLDPSLRKLLGAVALALLILAAHSLRRRWDRNHPGGARGFLRTHRPLFVVYGGILLVLALDLLLSGRAYAIVTLHVAAWYVFALQSVGRGTTEANRPSAGSWSWIRRTREGFNAFHTALLVGVIGLAAWWAYGFANSEAQEALWVLLSKDAFPYWTIMHVTISFVPK